MSDDRREKARARALRAAQVVTLGLSAVGMAVTASGCAASHTPGSDDAGSRAEDAQAVADAPCPPVDFSRPPTTRMCCESAGFWWDASSNTCIVAVPGPFVPPAMA